jgi:basic amino acid/polyamine antiporter, APA family
MTPSQPEESLRRELSRLAIGTLAINGLIGAGIFGLPAKAAELTGSFSPVMFVVCGVLMSALLLSFGQAASFFQGTGGPILYTQAAFGSFVGFQTGWILYVGRATSLAANSILLATYAAQFAPGIDGGVQLAVLIFVVCAVLTVVNVLGIKQGMRSVYVITVAKLVPLLTLIVVGIAYVSPASFANAELPSYGNFGESALLLFYAFIGFEGSIIPAGEARDPRRDIPRALILTGLVTTILYVLIQTVCIAALPTLAETKRPLAEAASVMMGRAGATLISAGAIVSIAGNMAASVLTAPRMTYAMALDRGLPRWFAAIHAIYRTPHLSIVFYGAIVFLMAISGTFVKLAEMSTVARLIGYAACVASLPFLRRKFGEPEGFYRLPGGYAIPIVAFGVCLWLLTQVDWFSLLITVGFVAAGAILFALARWRRASEQPQ